MPPSPMYGTEYGPGISPPPIDLATAAFELERLASELARAKETDGNET